MSFKKFGILSFVLILFGYSGLFSQGETAQFQLIVPAPDPVQAGEKITFQILTVNTGKKSWDISEAELEIEIYDSNKNYLLKTEKVRNKEIVPSGGSDLEFLTFQVPTAFRGVYYFRVGLMVRGQRIAYSDFLQFNVTALEAVPKPPSKFEVGGNAIFSYTSDSKKYKYEGDTNVNSDSYLGNVSLNLLGTIYQKAFAWNIYTNHTKEKNFDLYNFIFNYYSDNFDLALGDVMPAFSVLSLSNAGMRGILPTVKYKALTTSVVFARSVEPQEGTLTANGSFARYVYGGSGKLDFAGDSSIGVSLVVNSDDKNSIQTPGPSLSPIQNQVMAVNLVSGFLKYVTLKLDYARSIHSTGTLESPGNYSYTALEDSAYRLGLESVSGPVSFQGGFQMVGTDFNSPGSPTIVKDRISRDIFTGLTLSRLGNISLSYNDYEDNLKNDPEKITTVQRIYSSGLGITIPKLPLLSAGYTRNEIFGKQEKERNLLNNYTDIISAGIAYSFPWLTLSVSGQDSKFRNEVSTTTNTDTLSGNFGITFQYKELLSVNIGFNRTSIKDLSDLSLNELNTYSITANLKIIPEKLVLVTWGNTTERKDNDKTSPAETNVRTVNLELTYYFTPQFAWTLGGGINDYTDKLNENNDYTNIRAVTRVSLGF